MTADLHPDTGATRPGTCCGACPPIAGGGWDCTCEGNARCPAAMADAGLGKSAEAAELAAQLVATVRDLSEARSALHAATGERDALAARLAAVEALLVCDCGEPSCVREQIRAALSAAPTDTTKETP